MVNFKFPLSADDEKRNAELLSQKVGYNKVILGDIVLAVESITPRQVKFELKNTSWLRKTDLGMDTRDKKTIRKNKDGTTSTIIETETSYPDGTIKIVTVETVSAILNGKVQSTSSTLDIPLVDPDSDKTLDGEDKDLWLSQARKKITTTRTRPFGTSVEYVTEKTEEDPENPDVQSVRTKKYTNQQKPVPQAKPVELVTITGKRYDQFIGPAPPQGQDQYWWNDAMLDTDELVTTTRVDNGDGTETTTTCREYFDSDNFKTEEVTEVTADKTEETDTRSELTATETSPGIVKSTKTLYDRNDQFVSETITTTSKWNTITGESLLQVTSIEEETTDALGKIILKTTETQLDPKTEEEITTETEEVIEPGQDTVTYNRTINTDISSGQQTISETITTTDGYGVSNSETREEKRQIATSSTSEERITDYKDDDIVDDIINGYLITEYEITGEMMSMPRQFKIKNKQIEHQAAWAFLKIREEQLNLGDRITPAKRKQLWREWKSVFLGEPDELVRGGPVLDRIDLYAYGEVSIPVVFSPDADSFRAEPIRGAYGLYKWRMLVQRYEQVIREKDNSFRQEKAGGIYGRSDNEHWHSSGHITDDQSAENANYEDGIDKWRWN